MARTRYVAENEKVLAATRSGQPNIQEFYADDPYVSD